jgi:hypothetical protein
MISDTRLQELVDWAKWVAGHGDRQPVPMIVPDEIISVCEELLERRKNAKE